MASTSEEKIAEETPLAAVEIGVAALKENVYEVKWFNFRDAMFSVVTQNENGPCPLLAVINVLLLRVFLQSLCSIGIKNNLLLGQVYLPKNAKTVSEKHLLELVGDCLLKLKPKNLEESQQVNYEQILNDVLELVQTLPHGLDVNPYFEGVSSFEFTPSCSFFDALDIRLLHGWVVDPEQAHLVELLKGFGYNQIAEKAVGSSYDENAPIFRHFLESTASQLTEHGLRELSHALQDGSIAVLFRNNHFHTLYKNHDDLFVLVTDQGYLTEPYVIWETLSVDGNSTFVDANFQDSSMSKRNAEATAQQVSEESDYLYALSIQEEEKAEAEARARAEEERSARPVSAHPASGDMVNRPTQNHQAPATGQPHPRRHERDDKLCSVM